jgi:F-type H+-transporting ATPase subunit a
MLSFVHTAYAAEEGISVHLAPYILGEIWGISITPTMLTVWLTMAILIVVAYIVGKNPKLIPSKFQIAFEMLIGGVYDYIADVFESKTLATKYFPIIMTIFLFILTMNWVGLLPGVTSIGFWEVKEGTKHLIPLLYPPATDLNITIAFALVAFFTIEIAGVVAIGVWKYAGKFINFKSPLAFVIGLIELLSELARLISFSFRLFGNIFAGKTLLLVVMFLATPYILPVPLIAYEFFVGFIQAFIFAILTLYFIKLAVEEPH